AQQQSWVHVFGNLVRGLISSLQRLSVWPGRSSIFAASAKRVPRRRRLCCTVGSDRAQRTKTVRDVNSFAPAHSLCGLIIHAAATPLAPFSAPRDMTKRRST